MWQSPESSLPTTSAQASWASKPSGGCGQSQTSVPANEHTPTLAGSASVMQKESLLSQAMLLTVPSAATHAAYSPSDHASQSGSSQTQSPNSDSQIMPSGQVSPL